MTMRKRGHFFYAKKNLKRSCWAIRLTPRLLNDQFLCTLLTTVFICIWRASYHIQLLVSICIFIHLENVTNWRQFKILDFADNELIIGWDGRGTMMMNVQRVNIDLELCCGYEMSDFVYGWQRYCFTYNSAGSVKVRQFQTILKLCYLLYIN